MAGRPRSPFDAEKERRRRAWRESKARAIERKKHVLGICRGEDCPLETMERVAVPRKNGQGHVLLPR
jgi:hypothetical protein